MGKNTVKKIGNERSKKNLTAGMADRNNIGNEKQMKQSISHRPHLSYRKNLAAHRSTPAKKLSALERFNRFKALRDKNLKRQVKKLLPGGKVKIKTPKKTDKNMATETIVNGSHDETKTEQNETTSVQEVIASIKLRTPVVELQKEVFAADNTNGVTEENTVVENDKEARNGHDNGIEGESETEMNVEKPSKPRQVRKSKTNENANKIKEKAKQKRDSKSVTPTRRVSKRIKRNEEERDDDFSVVENDSSTDINNSSKEEMHDTKENDDVTTDISLSLEHESTPFENDVDKYAATLKEPYEGEENAKEDEISMDTSESKTSIHEKSGNILEENDSAVGSSHDFSLSFNEYEEDREQSMNNAVASSSVFSMIRRSLRKETRPKLSPVKKATPEPCTSNVYQYESSAEIKIPKRNIYSGISGRKPLRPTSMYNSYYKTKGTESTNRYSLKRKSTDIDNYFDSTERKRFAGDVGNTTLSEKSPGWKFFSSPFNRFWSPKEENTDTSVKSSTPYQKREMSYSVEESLVVNYNEETVAKSTVGSTHIDMEESKTSSEEGKSSSLVNKYCVIM